MTEIELQVDPAHPAFAGHFPAHPIVPGVLLLDEVMRAIESQAAAGSDFVQSYRLASVKFLKPAGPGAWLRIRAERKAGGQIVFTVSEGGQTVASGSFAPLAVPD